MHVSAVILLVAAAVAAPSPLTKAEVIQRGSAICRAAEHRVETIPQIQSEHPFAKSAPKGDKTRAIRFLAVYADALESVRVGLAKLDAPAQGRPLLLGFVADLRPTVATF